MLGYQQPDSSQTLAQGLTEYYASRDGLVLGRGASDAAHEFFRCHDAAHVVFGCSTELTDELATKMWSFFGTDEGFRLMRGYALPESKEIYETLEFWPMVSTGLRSFSIVPCVWWRARQMARAWPWSDFERYQDIALASIRGEFGIEVLHAR